MSPHRFAKAVWAVIAFNFAVIAWGGYVRASGSGAGCGRHWPMCNGEVLPRAPKTATVVEFTHRATSGFALLLVVGLAVLAFRVFPKGHPVRRTSLWSLAFMFGEALIGAGLVLFELVAHDASMKRALSMALHLTNTFFLLGALALTAFRATHGDRGAGQGLREPRALSPAWFLVPAMVGVVTVATSGAIAALGDTLFPARTWTEGLAQDLSPTTHLLLRLRLLHPFLAMITGALVVGAAVALRHLRPSPAVARASRLVILAFLAQFTAGLINLALLAPTAMQLLHLVLADLVWLSLVWLAATAAVQPRGSVRVEEAKSVATPLTTMRSPLETPRNTGT